GADRRDLEQHAARLAEVHRAEVEAIDHRRRVRAGFRDAGAPGLLVLRLRGERHVMHRPGPLAGDRLRRRGVVGVEATALLAANLPALPVLARESERVQQQTGAARRPGAVLRARAETTQRA